MLVGHPADRATGRKSRRPCAGTSGTTTAQRTPILVPVRRLRSQLAEPLEFREKVDLGHDCRARVRRHARPTQDGCRSIRWERCQDSLADRGAVDADATSYLGEHPHRMAAWCLCDVDDVVVFKHREVNAFADFVHEVAQLRFDPVGDQPTRALT